MESEQLEALIASTREERVDAGTPIFAAGQTGDCMFFIVDGAVDLLFPGSHERKQLGAGQYFGELALLRRDARRTASAVAAVRTLLRRLDRPDFEALARTRPDVFAELLRESCNYLVDSERRLSGTLEQKRESQERTLEFLRRTREEREVQHLRALTDDLTGLYNRRCIHERANQILADDAAGTALILLDVDRFKQINDAYGHQIGDLVLEAFARVVKAAALPNDLPCRIGGDEFALLLVRATPAQLRARCLALFDRLSSLSVPLSEGEVTIGTSIGATAGQPGDRWDVLYRRADEALYAAKRAGRNRAIVEQELLTVAS